LTDCIAILKASERSFNAELDRALLGHADFHLKELDLSQDNNAKSHPSVPQGSSDFPKEIMNTRQYSILSDAAGTRKFKKRLGTLTPYPLVLLQRSRRWDFWVKG
jgi:hypothetical protein